MFPVQYDLFKTNEECEIDQLKEDMKIVRESNDKVRKGLFARHNELAKLYVEVHNRLEVIERGICQK